MPGKPGFAVPALGKFAGKHEDDKFEAGECMKQFQHFI